MEAYPLSWPAGWPRTPIAERKAAKFHRSERMVPSTPGGYAAARKVELSIFDAVKRVQRELELFGVLAHTIVISTNVETRRDGLPRSDRRMPTDPGVAVYWQDPDTDVQQAMAIDLYDTVAGNLAAIAATIDAMRAIERHGGAQVLKRAFSGFKALPSATVPVLSTEQAARAIAWRENGAEQREPATVDQLADMILTDKTWARDAVRRALAKTHPDRGGSLEDFRTVQEARRILQVHHHVDQL